MAKPEAKESEGTSEPFICKRCVLRVSIHCEGCKRKVIKILHNINGVHAVEIDRKQQKVTVTSNIDEQNLIRKLIKAGKHAESWPEEKPISKNIKEKENATEIPAGETSAAVHDDRKQKQSTETEASAKELQIPSENEEKCGINGNSQVHKMRNGGGVTAEIDGAATERVVGCPSPEDAGDKSIAGETQPSGPSSAVAVEAGGGGGGEGRKKKKGQRKEKRSGEEGGGGGGIVAGDMVSPQRVPAPASIESTTPLHPHHHHQDQIPSSNYNPPLNQAYNYPIHAVVSHPANVASYNTAHPSSTSGPFYATPPPYSHAYVHSVASRDISQPLPLPLPSPPLPLTEQSNSPPSSPFDFFSDENPSGCFVM